MFVLQSLKQVVFDQTGLEQFLELQCTIIIVYYTTRIPEMLGFYYFLGGGGIKTKTYREHNKCLNRELLHIYPLNQLISNVIPATGLKKVVSGQQRAEKMTF